MGFSLTQVSSGVVLRISLQSPELGNSIILCESHFYVYHNYTNLLLLISSSSIAIIICIGTKLQMMHDVHTQQNNFGQHSFEVIYKNHILDKYSNFTLSF